MRGLRSLIVLVVILGGLGAYIYFVESKREPASEGTETKAKALTLEAEKVEELQIKAGSGPTATVRKTKGTWDLVEPEATKADETEASGIASNLASLEIQRVVDENPASLADYGLDPPRADVAFRTAGAKDFRHLLIGDKTPTGGDLYVKFADEKRVFLIASYLDTTFVRTPFDLRDKSLISFDREKLDKVEVSAGQTTLELARAAGEWSLTKPFPARADYGTAEGLVSRIQSARMKSIVPFDPKKLAQYGLDRPQAAIAFLAGSARSNLAIGKAAPDGTLYARDAARPMVFTVEASLMDDLKKPVSDFRRKDIFEFRTFNGNRVEISRGGQTTTFEKRKGEGANATDTWQQVSPATKLEAAKIEDVISRISNLRAASFVDPKVPTNLNTPVAVVTVKFDDSKKEERVTFGRVGTDVYAGRADETGAAKLEAADFDAAMKALDELK